MKIIKQLLSNSTDSWNRVSKAELIKSLIDLNDLKGETFIEELEELIENYDKLKGKYVTSVEPHELFNKAMHFKSDSNPFTDDGDCAVKDGYKHCENSCTHYFEMTMEQIEN
jgi:hypothetical protein